MIEAITINFKAPEGLTFSELLDFFETRLSSDEYTLVEFRSLQSNGVLHSRVYYANQKE